jgi:hypothetical protein
MGRKKKEWQCGHRQCQEDRKEITRLTGENMQILGEFVAGRLEIASIRSKLKDTEAKLRATEAGIRNRDEQAKAVARELLSQAHTLIGG